MNRVENTKKYRVIGRIVPEIKKISQFTALRVQKEKLGSGPNLSWLWTSYVGVPIRNSRV